MVYAPIDCMVIFTRPDIDVAKARKPQHITYAYILSTKPSHCKRVPPISNNLRSPGAQSPRKVRGTAECIRRGCPNGLGKPIDYSVSYFPSDREQRAMMLRCVYVYGTLSTSRKLHKYA